MKGWMLAAACATALVATGCEENGGGLFEEPAVPTGETGQVAGVLANADGGVVEIKTVDGELLAFDYAADRLRVTAHGNPATLEDLPEGTQVRATFEAQEDGRELLRLEVAPVLGTP